MMRSDPINSANPHRRAHPAGPWAALALAVGLAGCGQGDLPPTTRDLRNAVGGASDSFTLPEDAERVSGIRVPERMAIRELTSKGCSVGAEPEVYVCQFSLVIYDPQNGAGADGILAEGEGSFRRASHGFVSLQNDYELTARGRAVMPGG